MTITTVLIFFAILCIYFIVPKFIHSNQRRNSQKLKATVVEYRKEKIKSLRNDFTKIEYPYVKIETSNETELICLRNASSTKKYYQIGDKIEVFWSGDKLLPWKL